MSSTILLTAIALVSLSVFIALFRKNSSWAKLAFHVGMVSYLLAWFSVQLSFGTSRDGSKVAASINSCKQMAISSQVYAEDNDNRILPIQNWRTILTPYLKNNELGLAQKPFGTGIGMNQYIGGRKVSEIEVDRIFAFASTHMTGKSPVLSSEKDLMTFKNRLIFATLGDYSSRAEILFWDETRPLDESKITGYGEAQVQIFWDDRTRTFNQNLLSSVLFFIPISIGLMIYIYHKRPKQDQWLKVSLMFYLLASGLLVLFPVYT